MKSELLNKNASNAEVKVTVPREKFNDAIQKAYNKNKGKYNIQGFRKGKTPKKVIENMYGEDVFYYDALNIVLPELFEEAIKEHDIKAIDAPSVDFDEIPKEGDFDVTFKVDTEPEFTLGKYKGLEIKEKSKEVQDKDVKKELKDKAKENARIRTKTRGKIKNGEIAVIDFEGFIDGEKFEGGTGENYSLEIGSNTFIPGFEEQLIGASKDEVIEVNVSFPEEYQEKSLAGKPVMFRVTIKEIKIKEVPTLDDEFAKDISEFDTFDELYEDTKEKMIKQNEEAVDRAYREELIGQVLDATEIDIPQAMVRQSVENMFNEFNHQLSASGLKMENYLQMMGKTEAEIKKEMEPEATKRVKADLVITEIINKENITATDDEYNDELKKLAESMNTTVEELDKKYGNINKQYLEDIIKNKKVFEMLIKNAKFV